MVSTAPAIASLETGPSAGKRPRTAPPNVAQSATKDATQARNGVVYDAYVKYMEVTAAPPFTNPLL